MNYMEQIANMLGVELGESFKINDGYGFLGSGQIFQLTERGLVIQSDKNQSTSNRVLNKILTGKYGIVKIPWKPKDGEAMWTIKWNGEEYQAYEYPYDSKSVYCVMCVATGNCFKTKDDAEHVMPEMLELLKRGENDNSGVMIMSVNDEYYRNYDFTKEECEVALKYVEELSENNGVSDPETCDIVKRAISKQTPTMPDVLESDDGGCDDYRCPECGIHLSFDEYCSNCGQRLDWSDDNE